MTDITRYANVSLKRDTYNKLKDLSAMNRTPVSKSGLITYLVDKEWNNTINHYTKPASKKACCGMLGIGWCSWALNLGLQVKVNQMTIDNKKVLVSDRGLKHQVFVEHPPVVAASLRSYINSFKRIKEAVRETYPTAKFYFKDVDELSMELKQ